MSRLGILFGRPVAVLLLAGACAARAGEPESANGSELDALIAEALERNSSVREARELADAAKQRIRPASALADPMVSVALENEGVSPSLGTEAGTRLDFMAQQAIPFPGKLALAGKIASTEANEVATRTERARLSVEAQVRRAYADLLLARENVAIVAEQLEAWKDIEEVTRIRYGAGMGSQQDILRAQSEKTRLAQQQVRDEAAAENALVELSRVVQRPVGAAEIRGHRLTFAGLAPAPPPTVEEARRLALEASPELREARLARERTGVGVDLARKNLKPDFVASAGYTNRGGLPLMWSVGLGVSVPLWASRKQAPLIVGAQGRSRAAAEAQTAVETRLVAATQRRLVRLEQLRREAEMDAEGVLVQDRLAVDAALANYRSGGVPFVSVLEAQSTLFIDRRAAVSRLADHRKTEADLKELSLEGADSGSAGPMSSPQPSSSSASKM